MPGRKFSVSTTNSRESTRSSGGCSLDVTPIGRKSRTAGRRSARRHRRRNVVPHRSVLPTGARSCAHARIGLDDDTRNRTRSNAASPPLSGPGRPQTGRAACPATTRTSMLSAPHRQCAAPADRPAAGSSALVSLGPDSVAASPDCGGNAERRRGVRCRPRRGRAQHRHRSDSRPSTAPAAPRAVAHVRLDAIHRRFCAAVHLERTVGHFVHRFAVLQEHQRRARRRGYRRAQLDVALDRQIIARSAQCGCRSSP